MFTSSLAGLTVFVANIVILFFLWHSGSQHTGASAALALCFILFSFQYASLVAGQAFKPITFSALVFWGYGFIMPGLYQVRTEKFFWASRAIAPEIIIDAAMGVLIGAFTFFMGLITGGAPNHARKSPNNYRKLPSAALPVGIAFLYVFFVLATSGPIVFFGTRGAVIALSKISGQASSLHGLTLTLSRGMALAALAIAGTVFLQRRTPSSLVILMIAVLTNIIANFPLAVPRFYLVAFLFVLGLSIFRKVFTRYAKVIYIMAPVTMYLIFPTLGRFSRTKEFDFSFTQVPISEYLAHGDLDGFESVMNAVLLTQEWGFSYGQRLLSSFLFFVPRSIWPGKAESTGHVAAENANYAFLNISMPLPGEFYSDFGYFGVAIGMAAVGYMINYLDRRQAFTGTAMILGILLAAFMPILLRGALLSTIQGFASSVFLITIWHFSSKIRILHR